MNKKIIITLLCLCVVALGGWKYVEYKQHCNVYFPSNTVINSVDCSGLTVADAAEKLSKEWNSRTFTIKAGDKTIGTLEGLKFAYNIEDSLSEVLHDGARLPVVTTLLKKNQDVKIDMTPAKETDSFEEFIDELPVYEQKDPVTTKNAYVSMKNNKYEIVEEIYGNNIDKDKLKTAVTTSIAEDVWSMDFVEKDFYDLPEITKESQEILDRQAYCQTYLAHEITYIFGGDSYTITPSEMDELISVDENGKVKANKKAVESFVAELATKYDTYGTVRAFKSSARGTVYLNSRGNYGYVINQAEEVKLLTENLVGLEDVSREPVYSMKGVSRYNGDIGTTYVEVDLANQTLWYYVNGNLMIRTPIVSGNVAENHHTVTGVFALQYKTRDVTLKGGNEEDGTDYASDVRYWMPFYGEFGLHDADWRNAFGGSIYLTNGSHGCVNMPIPAAETLYNNIWPGTPVIVYA